MESVLDDCLAQFSSKYVLKEEQRQAVLGLLEQKNASPLWSIINDQVEAIKRSWHLSHCITLPKNQEVMWTFYFFFKLKAIIVVLAFLKAGFNKKSSSGASNLSTARQTNPTWLIFCLRNGKTKIFRFVTPWRTLSKKILCSFTGTRWLPSTIAVYKAPTYPTLNNQMCRFFRSRYSFSGLFRHRSSLRRVWHASTNTQLQVSMLFDCKIPKPNTQAIYICSSISPIKLVRRTWRW